MIGFQELVTGLGLAFKHATGLEAKVTFNEHSNLYGGRFLKLVEAVLLSVEKIATDQSLPLQFPASQRRRARYVYEMTRKGSRKKRARALPKTSNREP